MADAPTPAADDDDSTVIRLPKGGKSRLDNDDEVFAARKAEAIAKAKAGQAKAEKEAKDLTKAPSDLDKKTSHAEKVTKYFKAETEHHEAKRKYREHSVPFWKILLGIMAVIFVLFAVAAMNQPHPSPGLAYAQHQVIQGGDKLLVWLGGLGVVVFFFALIKSSAGKQKKSASGGGGAKHH